ncbi:hypothetical protein CYLTODRAFT_456733 [Cylindrobasidium torrendii FP15055 ss-10]|uniref:DUF6987 domain-containing protein n=1 Tax=Cylindrobasidium torrendii FP15055 ss-10 TaxID=1314674 RepID=A0A0D7B429_9AGAR|nr:hypothetical protein CYLTODRAFT_456733 [Cylindrobasidium torrendii FP15055 ss-10]
MFFARVATLFTLGLSVAAAPIARPAHSLVEARQDEDVSAEVQSILKNLVSTTNQVLPTIVDMGDNITEEAIVPLMTTLFNALQTAKDDLTALDDGDASASGSASAAPSSTSAAAATSSAAATATSASGSAAATASSAATPAKRDVVDDAANTLSGIVSDVTKTLDPILGKLQDIPAANDLLGQLDPLLGGVVDLVNGLLPGVVDLLSGLLGDDGLLGGLLGKDGILGGLLGGNGGLLGGILGGRKH